MSIKLYKTVLLPIKVPVGDYCWEPTPPHTICDHFDNEGGHPNCNLDLGLLKYEKEDGVLKPEKCRLLKEAKMCDSLDLLTFQFPKPGISLPTHPVLLSEAKRRGFFLADTPYNKLFSKLFFRGGQVVFKEGVDQDFLEEAFPYLRAFMGTFACPHEEKNAICAMLLSELVEPELKEA